MHWRIPGSRWTVAVALTVAVVLWARRQMRGHSGGDYNFVPAIVMSIAFVVIAAIWAGVLISAAF
jgi:hypothetical protein